MKLSTDSKSWSWHQPLYKVRITTIWNWDHQVFYGKFAHDYPPLSQPDLAKKELLIAVWALYIGAHHHSLSLNLFSIYISLHRVTFEQQLRLFLTVPRLPSHSQPSLLYNFKRKILAVLASKLEPSSATIITAAIWNHSFTEFHSR